MSTVTWVKIASWHVLRFDAPTTTVCGLEVGEDDETFDHLPPEWWKEKSCETCLRIKEARSEADAMLAELEKGRG